MLAAVKKHAQRSSASSASSTRRPRALVLGVLHFLLVILSTTFAAAGARPVVADSAPALSEHARVFATRDGPRVRPVESRIQAQAPAHMERIARAKATGSGSDRSSRPLSFVAVVPASLHVGGAPFVSLAAAAPSSSSIPALHGAVPRARGPPATI